jgi:D-sedoheptulose 7-phosphate isomerase
MTLLEERLKLIRHFWTREGNRIQDAVDLVETLFRTGHRLFVAGNGGSAAQADHFVAELIGRFERKRNQLPAYVLLHSPATLTALSNDFSYEKALMMEFFALASPGDGLMLLTTSGQSPNILQVLEKARTSHHPVILLTGEKGHPLSSRADVALVVPHTRTDLIQEVHLMILHDMARMLEQRFLDNPLADTYNPPG